jgi:hypothetical protein
MRTNILKSILFLVVLFISSCESNLRMPEVALAALPKITFDASSEKLILDGVYTGKFTVDGYYKDLPAEANIVITMNGNYTSPKVFKSGISTFPSMQTLTATDLKTMFSLSTIQPGNYFEVGVDVKLASGIWYPAFNPKGVAYGSGPTNLPGSSLILRIPAVCGYNTAKATGSYHSVSPPSEWASEGNVTITLDPTDKYTVYVAGLEALEGVNEDKGPLKMVINPADYSVKVTKTILASGAWGYHNLAYGGSGIYDPCTGTFKMSFSISADEGSWGSFAFTLTKN